MRMTKKVLALALSLMMIVSMFSIVTMSASAAALRADAWNGYITTTLNISGADPIDEDNYFTLSETDLYVGDSIKTNGNWLNYALNYTNDADETVSSKVSGMSAWYCDDTRMFTSQLQYAKINGATDNNPVTLTKAGTWRLYASLEDGKQLTLITFEVKEFPRFITTADGESVFTGAKNAVFYPEAGVPISEDEIYVGDTLRNYTGGDWWNNKDKYPISYTMEDGTEVTGVITHLHFYGPNTDLYYSVWNGDENTFTFNKAGTYRVNAKFEKVTDAEGNAVADFEVDLRTFEVKAMPRMYATMDGKTTFDANKNVNVYADTGIPFSVEDLYVGDTLQNGSGWWKDNSNIRITYEGVEYTCRITYLDIAAPKSGTTKFMVWNGGAIGYTLSEAGTYKVYGQAEAVKNVETGESVDNLYGVLLREFEVKAAPRQFTDAEGNESFGGSKAIKFYPQTGIPFSEDEIFVGDTIQNSTGGDWWNNKDKYPISYTKDDGTVVTGVVTHLHFYGPNADLYYSLWQGNSNVLKFTNAGTYRVTATFEKVTDAEGNSVGNFTADIRTFEVKACPHDYEAVGTIAPTCDTKGYDSTVCTICGDEINTNYVDATGHDLTCGDGVVNCLNCDYTRTYDAENTTVEIKVNDPSGKTMYTKVEAAAFVGETLINTNGGWWSDYKFTNGDYTGKVYNVWVVKGDLDYFKEYMANRVSNEAYTDENVFYAQVGYGSTINYTFDEAGTYTVVGAIQYAETSTFLTDVHPFEMATIEVFDAPVINVGPTYVEGLKIAGKNVAFAADYTMLFAVSKANYEAYEQVYLEVQKKLYEGDVEFETATLTETEMLNGMYAFRYKNFAAREIASEVQATVYAKDADGNVFYGPTLTYSMREYAENQIGKTTNAYFKVMMVDFLNYGAAAQNHFAYNKDDLANKNIDAYQGLATKDVTIEDEKGGHTDTSYEIDVTNFNLIFKSKITMVFATGMTDAEQAAYAAAGAYAKVTYTNFEGEAMAVEIALDDATNVVKQSGKWCVMYDGMKAREMDTIVTVAIYDADGNQISNQVTYSVNSYVYSKLNNSSTTLVALVNAMARFGYANQQYNLNK